MWIEAGFSPDDFWHQTPRLFQLAMQGVRKRLDREARDRTIQAWETGAFAASGAAGKLKPLKHYLPTKTSAQAPRDMLAAMLAYQANGAKMTVRKIERK